MTSSPFPPEIEALDPVRRRALLALSRTVVGAYRLARDGRVAFGHDVVANHRLLIRGPGRVVVGDRANLYAFSGRTVLDARTAEALIRIGPRTRVNETLVQADLRIEIGADCILGRAHILDTDMHSAELDRRTNPRAAIRRAPVVLEDNVWVARGAAILPGVTVGTGSVVGYGAVVASDVPPGVVVAGNPARVVREL